MRKRIALVIALAAAAPTAGIAAWFALWFSGDSPQSAVIALGVTWTVVVGGLALWYGTVAAGFIVSPLEALTASLRRFDPSLGDAAHPALAEDPADPEETAALRAALRQAVERIARDRSQKEAVMGGLMHDLKTPLVAQSLLIDRLASARETDSAIAMSELRRSTHGAVARLNRLIDVLRVDVAAPSTVAAHTRLISVVLQAVLDSLRPLIDSRDVTLAVDLQWDNEVDAESFRRALENVAANAIRYAATRVRIEVLPGVVRVVDDGPGFSQPFTDLLDPFRFGACDTERPPGTAGLGLYIARRSLEARGGQLKLESSHPGHTVVLLYPGLLTT